MEKIEYKPLTLPTLSWNKKSLGASFGELVAQPLEPGFGITLGNALRRILLAAVEGSAVTSVIIKGVNNEFASISGVVEDATQLVLNMKQIVIRNKKGKPGTMHVRATGPGVVRVSDIVADEHLELVNKDHVIAHVADGGELDIQFFVETGRGYRPAQWPAGKALQDDNRIYLDAMFSPVTKVTFDVEKTRVGSEIDYDKLLLHVYTDGSENPVDATHYAVSILRTQLEHFLATPEIPFNEISAVRVESAAQESEAVVPTEVQAETETPSNADRFLMPIESLGISARSQNSLITAGIKRVIDLVNLTEAEAAKIKGFGRTSRQEVEEILKAHGLTFGMNIKEEDLVGGSLGEESDESDEHGEE